MNRDTKNRTIILAWIIILILITGVSYAYFTTTLSVNGIAKLVGTFDIIFSDATITDQSELETISISDDGRSLSFNVKLLIPGDSHTIEYTISNNGTIDAILEELSVTSPTDSDVTFQTSQIAGDLPSGSTKTGTITIIWNPDSVETKKDVNFDAQIIARQKVS